VIAPDVDEKGETAGAGGERIGERRGAGVYARMVWEGFRERKGITVSARAR
jgi:hypothetical protein